MDTIYPTNWQEAVHRLQTETYRIDPRQDFVIDRMRPEDAWGVARCFYGVYQEQYPFDTFYVPEKLVAEIRSGNMIAAVARTATGDIIGFGSLFRNVSPNPRIYETGQATVLPDYRGTLAVLCIQECLLKTVPQEMEIDAIFGEPVCNHLVMQKIASIYEFAVTGIELGVMPEKTYQQDSGQSERVSTLVSFRVLRDRPCDVYLPEVYDPPLRSLITRIPLMRRIRTSTATIPEGTLSTIVRNRYDASQVLRLFITITGEDVEGCLTVELETAKSEGIEVFQVVVNLGDPCCGHAVEYLRRQGFFFGALLPRWFDTDGLLLQKLSAVPAFTSLKLLSEDSRNLLGFIQKDLRDISGD